MAWDTAALQEYDIFKGIMGNNLVTLLDCISAEEVSLETGEVALPEEFVEKKVALILEGEVLAKSENGEDITLKRGELYGKSFPTGVKASSPCRVLIFNHGEIYIPCWFSCFFHAAFIDNVDKAIAEQK